jgi:hypothetical protein
VKLADLDAHVEHFRYRVLQDALNEATSAYWLRRAKAFAAVGSVACDEIAQACRNRSALALGGDDCINAVVCQVCGTPTSPWTCSCGAVRLPVEGMAS